MAKIMIDAGHGGSDYGATFQGRKEKDDVLRLALAVGEILEQNGVEVGFTRVTDVYDSPIRKAQIANESGADFFISLHRNSGVNPNTYEGVQTLLYDDTGVKAAMANSINQELENVGFKNLGIDIRRDLAVLRRTQMPALLVEAGFINNDRDNQLFDEKFDQVAQAIANGVLETLGQPPVDTKGAQSMHSSESSFAVFSPQRQTMEATPMGEEELEIREVVGEDEMEDEKNYRYRVQIGLFRNYQNASLLAKKMEALGLPVRIEKNGSYYSVQVGDLPSMEEGTILEQDLRMLGYDTLLIAV